jgi:hypothetical protein
MDDYRVRRLIALLIIALLILGLLGALHSQTFSHVFATWTSPGANAAEADPFGLYQQAETQWAGTWKSARCPQTHSAPARAATTGPSKPPSVQPRITERPHPVRARRLSSSTERGPRTPLTSPTKPKPERLARKPAPTTPPPPPQRIASPDAASGSLPVRTENIPPPLQNFLRQKALHQPSRPEPTKNNDEAAPAVPQTDRSQPRSFSRDLGSLPEGL